MANCQLYRVDTHSLHGMEVVYRDGAAYTEGQEGPFKHLLFQIYIIFELPVFQTDHGQDIQIIPLRVKFLQATSSASLNYSRIDFLLLKRGKEKLIINKKTMLQTTIP